MRKQIVLGVYCRLSEGGAFAALPDVVVKSEVAVPPPPVVVCLRGAPFMQTNRNRCLPAEPATEARECL